MFRSLGLLALGCGILVAQDAPQLISTVDVFGAPANSGLETRAGDPLDSGKLERDVKTLYMTQRPSDVQVEELPEGDAVHVIFRVKPRHSFTLRKIQVDPPTPGLNAGIQPGSPIDYQTAQQIGAALHRQLERQGYPNSSVEASLVPTDQVEADLHIHIDKKQAVDVGAVRFTGDLGVPPSSLRGALRSTKSRTLIPTIPGVWGGWHLLPGYNADSAPADVANIRSFYYKHGFFDATVRTDTVDINGGKARIDFSINAGPRYAIRSFTLMGHDGPQQIRTNKDGSFPLSAACGALLAERRKAERDGVLDFSAKIEFHPVAAPAGDQRQWADLTATVERGPAYTTGRIEFRGNHRFGDILLRRMLLLDEQAPLDQMKLRKSIAALNASGFFQPLTERSIVVNTPPGSHTASVTIWLEEKKARSWAFSGPVGPMSIAGPLEFSLGSRLPSWGQGILDLSTYMLSVKLMYFATPIGNLIPFLPNKRFIPLITLSRPLLPGQRFLSGVTFIPQLGWQGMLLGYGVSQTRDLLHGVFQSDRNFTPELPVTMAHAEGPTGNDGTMFCEPPKTALDWTKQIGGMLTNAAFAFLPF